AASLPPPSLAGRRGFAAATSGGTGGTQRRPAEPVEQPTPHGAGRSPLLIKRDVVDPEVERAGGGGLELDGGDVGGVERRGTVGERRERHRQLHPVVPRQADDRRLVAGAGQRRQRAQAAIGGGFGLQRLEEHSERGARALEPERDARVAADAVV